MVNFAMLQQAVKSRLDKDRTIQTIEASGKDIEEAVAEAAALLTVPVRDLEYEVLLLKTSFLGLGENICKIRAFERPNTRERRLIIEETTKADDFGELELETDTDGEAFVQCRPEGVFLKVTAPIGTGKKADLADTEKALKERRVTSWSVADVEKALKMTGQYIRVSGYQHIAANDATARIEVAETGMYAYITVMPPLPGGRDLTLEDYQSLFLQSRVTNGVNESFMQRFADKPLYKQRVCFATGKKAIDGMDSFVEYFFETDMTKARFHVNQTGQVNFKELNIIQNVAQGERLARKVDAQSGIDGYTVTGETIPSTSGKEMALQLGKNVSFAADGRTIVADINGQVVFSNNKISVDLTYTVDGSVNLKTGNINFLGNVCVNGNVEEGFSIRAEGNIEIHGTVNKASLQAAGEIIVNQGITGKEGTLIEARGSIWAKFIENAHVDAGEAVFVTDGIINSVVVAEKKIICQGKRAAVMGGRLIAGDEINAKRIGSPSGNTETVCEVGYEPKVKKKMNQLEQKRAELQSEFDDAQLNLQTLTSIKVQRGTLPEDKETYFAELTERRKILAAELVEINKEHEVLENDLKSIKLRGRISASSEIMPGVLLCIRDQREVVRTEYKASTFVLENDIIRATAYTEVEADT